MVGVIRGPDDEMVPVAFHKYNSLRGCRRDCAASGHTEKGFPVKPSDSRNVLKKREIYHG